MLIGEGTNLSSLGITALNSDKGGTLRGESWEIGAYEYQDETPPEISNPLPSGTKTCDSNPLPQTLQVTTDENATCKYNLTDTDYDSMVYNFSTTGGTTHQQSANFNCGAEYTRYVRCIDGSSNESDTGTITFTVESESSTGRGALIKLQ
jgi:hypothetical protein